ncbi:MAG: DUF6475 domain-containing protein [Zoogloeaceae bacterium]|jgi:hypothetical protein|nr:DUF6475 domain-containing protein [Zoogloeaceae bacterium]
MMNENDEDKFKSLLKGVYDFYGKDLSEFALSIWWRGLKRFDFSAVSLAMSRHLMNSDTGQYLPKPADVMRMLGGRTEDRALTAWAKVDKAIRQVGPYLSVAFDDPLIHRVLHDMGGWIGLAQKTEDEWPFVGREFENRYRGFAMRGETPDYPRVLIGIAEAGNARKGLAVDPPTLIGDPARARQVMSGGTEKPLIAFTPSRESTEKLIFVECKAA